MSVKQALDAIDDGIYFVEKAIVSLFFAIMALVVFADVTHRIFITPDSKLGGMWMKFGASESLAQNVLGPLTLALFAFLLFYGGLRERWGRESSPRKALLFAAIWVGGLSVFLKIFLWSFPNGLIWSQTLGLSMMLWIGLVGASMAAKQRRHLALEFGTKIWPQKWQPYVRSISGLMVAVFCAVLAFLAWTLIAEEYRYFDRVAGTGMFFGLGLPKFLVYGILPYGFFMIVFRYLRGNQAATRELDVILSTQQDQPS
jgi:TRAP-type C4-dicarboxylate transport system permease small subunit